MRNAAAEDPAGVMAWLRDKREREWAAELDVRAQLAAVKAANRERRRRRAIRAMWVVVGVELALMGAVIWWVLR